MRGRCVPNPSITRGFMVDAQAFDDALSSIFAVPDPFAPELAVGVGRAALLYPTDYRFPPELIPALSEVSQRHGEAELYIAFSEVEVASSLRDNGFGPVRSIQFPLTFDPYLQLVEDPLQDAHVNGNATWAALFSNDEFGVIAGAEAFLADLETRLLATFEAQAIAFLRGRKEDHERFGFGIEWIPPVISTLFGPEHGSRLLAATGLETEPRSET